MQLKARRKKHTKGPAFLHNKGVIARASKDRKTQAGASQDDLARSQQALLAKAKLYDRMQGRGLQERPDHEEAGEGCLVDFEQKAIDRIHAGAGAEAHAHAAVDEGGEGGDDDWVDYVDAFGRDRRCLRRDLAGILKAEHAAAPAARAGAGGVSGAGAPPGMPEMLSADMRMAMEREQWERDALEEMQRRAPVQPVHFQGVIPNEIRQLGTGYYRFSTDEEERAKQMDKLNAIRDETLVQQSRGTKLKNRRKAMLEARLDKIKRRKGNHGNADGGAPPRNPPHATAEEAGGRPDLEGAGDANGGEHIDDFLAFYKEQAKHGGR